MFNKAHRLPKKEFDYYFKNSRSYQNDAAILRFAPFNTYKVAVVVGKKVSKRAVVRNRARRQIYAAIRRYHQTNPLLGVYICMAKPAFLKLPKKDHDRVLADLLSKAAIKS